MPFFKIHLSDEIAEKVSPLFAHEVREVMVETLKIDPTHGHVAVYTTPREKRSVHESRSVDFVFVELLMFSGRTDETKETLFRKLNEVVERHTGVDNKDIIFNVIESDRKDWAGRGGIPMSKIHLRY
ncbi:MAG: tautomerase family protein [Deltaproteobacteria bacterium]|uniref:Tautomerase family protein n=1 Tax=Candidatus Zymogenus saltonus TaxID=2844893 RepID=A0A9D8PN96_9DELT|nr:tautomerase family protein [Candidatus Zymogenus saltonus]